MPSQWIDKDPTTSVSLCLSSSISPVVCLPGRQQSILHWDRSLLGRQRALISLIINQYAAGSPSGEDFTQRWHLFSANTARDEGMEGGENKDISDSRHGWSMVLCWGMEEVDGGVLKVHVKVAIQDSDDCVVPTIPSIGKRKLISCMQNLYSLHWEGNLRHMKSNDRFPFLEVNNPWPETFHKPTRQFFFRFPLSLEKLTTHCLKNYNQDL